MKRTKPTVADDSFFTGRENEIAVFRNILFLQNNNDLINRHFAFSVTGEAGIGKTALIREFGRIASEDSALVVRGKCVSDAAPPFCIWGELLRDLLGITTETRLSYDDFTDLLSNRIDFEPIAESACFLSEILSINSDNHRLRTLSVQDRLLEIQIAFQILFELLAQKQKLVVLLDDLQWIDSAFLRILNALFRNCVTNYPIVFILSQRPDDENNGSVVPTLNPDFVRIENIYLRGINAASARAISIHQIENTTGKSCADLSEDLLSFLMYTSKESPLFLKQTVVNFLDAGRICVKDGTAVFADETVLAPVTLTGNALFRACVKDYSKEIIDILRAASVLGIEFNIRELQLVLRFMNRNYNQKALEDFMLEINIVEYSHQNLSSVLHFKHALIRDCIYDDIQDFEKELLHRAAAGALTKMRSDANESICGLIAYHYLNGNDSEQTIKWGTKTFLQAKQAYQNNKALLWADTLIKKLKQTGALPEKLFNIFSLKADICDVLGRRDEQQTSIRHMQEVAEKSGDEMLQLQAKRKYAWFLIQLGQFKKAEAILLEILGTVSADCKLLRQITLSSLASVYSQQGRIKESMPLHQKALKITREMHNSDAEARILINMGGVYKSLGMYDDSEVCYSKSLAFMKKAGNRRMISVIYGNLALLNNEQKKYDEAMDNYNKALEISRIIGNHRNEGTVLGNLAVLYEKLGRTDEALNLYKQSLEIAIEIKNRKHEGILLANISVIHLKRNKLDSAEELLLRAKDIALSNGDYALECFLSVALADVHFNRNKLAEARRWFKNARHIIEKQGFGQTANYECLLDLRTRVIEAGHSHDDFCPPRNWDVKE